MTIIDKIASFKTKRVKGNTQKWFDSDVLKKLNSRYKLFQKFKKLDSTLKKSYLRKQNMRR